MDKFIAAAIQMDSQDNIKSNLQQATDLIEEAVEKGAKLVALPELMHYWGREHLQAAEEVPGGESFLVLSKLAKKYHIGLHGGSIYKKDPQGGLPSNCTLVFNPEGVLAASYEKIHPFDVVLPEGASFKESDKVRPGKKIVTLDTQEVGHLGLAICYDTRFGEIFRLMALAGANIFLTPAAFTVNTGKDHWETLLRARAIENECYVVAPAQIGNKPKFQANANSMIIDPWGTVIARASQRVGVITAEIDLNYVTKVRHQTFSLANRRPDVYSLTEK